MVRFKELGFSSFEEFKRQFFSTLLVSNKTYEYFVDWKKVRENAKKYVKEISLLGSLTKIEKSKRKDYLYELIFEYPKIVEVFPILIAKRLQNKKLSIFDKETEEVITLDFNSENVDKDLALRLVEFCEKVGILDLFEEIKDLYDYILGIEVGLDTNARKNRSGEIFEKLIEAKLKSILKDKKIVRQDPNISLYKVIGKGKGKVHDFVVYKNDSPYIIIECNFYNTQESKPESIAESYPQMADAAKRQGLEFLWITDGPAWQKMKESLIRAMHKMDWISNYKLLEKILKRPVWI